MRGEKRNVPRPPVNIWKMVSEGKIKESDVSQSGRFSCEDDSQDDVPSQDELIRQYEAVLRARCRTPESVVDSEAPPIMSDARESLDARVGILEREVVLLRRALTRAGVMVDKDVYSP